MLLGDVMARYARGITISVPLNVIDKDFCTSMAKTLKSSKGSIPLKVFVTHNDMSLTMMAREHKVEVRKFLDAIKGMDCIYNVKIES